MTIEQRANKYMIEERSSIIKSGYDISFYDIERAYKTGANDQLQYDTDRAVKIHCDLCNHKIVGGCALYSSYSDCTDIKLIKNKLKN